MARRRRTKTREGAGEVPTSSFSDIAFLLIIYFMVATTLQSMRGFLTDLPAGQKSQEKTEQATSINITDNRITLNDDRVDPEALRRRLKELRLAEKRGDQKVVLLEAMGEVDYQTYYDVMAAVSGSGGVIGIVRQAEGSKQ